MVETALEDIEPNEWNPNVQDDETFNLLCENIQEIGFVEPLLVVPAGAKFRIISGEHRFHAARMLGMNSVPCVVATDFDEDAQKLQTVRMNLIKGALDPEKFTRLYNEMAAKYDAEALKRLMGFTDDAAFQKVYQEVKAGLPDELAEQLEKAKDDLKTIDDLAVVLNTLFTKYGSTLQYSFMVFTWGGKVHTMVRLHQGLRKKLDGLQAYCSENGVDINEEFLRRMNWEG